MNTILVDAKNKLHKISPILFGLFFEDINYAGDGGLYAELISNRSFEYFDRNGVQDIHKMSWEEIGNVIFEIQDDYPRNSTQKNYAFIKGESESGIKNNGFCNEGFSVKPNERFRFSCYAKSDSLCALNIQITNETHDILATQRVYINDKNWNYYEVELLVQEKVNNAYLEILLVESGEVYIDFVSLFPKDLYKNRFNGLRCDLAEMLEDISPKFLRFPGGCIVEGRSVSNMYNWKDTIGDITERKINWNRWQMKEYQPGGDTADDYFQSYGLGYYEYFLLCEDLGAKPIPVMNVGMTCQWHEGLLVPIDKLENWINDVLDLIEFANGDKNSKWGKIRSDMGHEMPFDLEYIGIGNEQWGEEYFARYELFQKAILKKYPEIKLITSAGWTSEGKEFDEAVKWMKENKDKAYAVDEHFYKSPEWFLENIERYDDYDRTMPKVFAGEYAAHTKGDILDRKNNWYTALSEAAFLTGLEKNSDHVIMACYAPLFARVGHQQWQPNLIWFDNYSCFGTPSYYVQKLFANMVGDELVETKSFDKDIKVSGSITVDGRRLIIKIVNISESDKNINLIINGEVGKGKVHSLCAELLDENSLENPRKVFPQTAEFDYFQSEQLIIKHCVTIYDLELV